MAQHDYDIANQTGANFRADLNNALDAIVSNNSGSSEPSTTFAYEWWIDTSANVLKLTPSDMKENKLIDKIIKEPLGGAHQNREKIFNTVKKEILSTYLDLKKKKIKDLLDQRLERFTRMGVFNE